MNKLHLDNKNVFNQPELKRQFNLKLFSVVAPRYDLITRILSLGRDYFWKKQLIAKLPPVQAPVCLDIACGTGDMCNLLWSRYPQAQLMGIDICDEMLSLAQQRNVSKNPIRYLHADMSQLPVADHSVDIITGGYALRNAPNLNRLLQEIARSLKPGGYAAFLDFSKPQDKKRAQMNHYLLSGWCRLWSILLHRTSEVYGYIPISLSHFPDTQQLKQLILQKGFTAYQTDKHFHGMLESILFRKPLFRKPPMRS